MGVAVVLILIGFVLALMGVAYLFQEKLIFIPEKLHQQYQFEFDGNWLERSFLVDGAELNAIHYKVDNPEGVLLYLHGNAGSLATWGHVGLDFTRLGQDVVVIDYRGYGKSSGKMSSESQVLSDVQAVYDAVKKEYSEDKITIYGRSLGSGMASYLAAHNSPKRLILETPYISLHKLGGEMYPKFVISLMKYKLPTNEYLAKIDSPVYMFHGTDDQLIGYHHARGLLKLKPSIKLYTIEEGVHNNLPQFPEYHIALAEIFAK